MSRYSPTVLPEVYGTDMGQRLAQAFADHDTRKRQRRADDITAIEHGIIPPGTTTLPDYQPHPDPLGGVSGDEIHDALRRMPVTLTPSSTDGGFVQSQPPAHAGHTPFDEDPRDFGLGAGGPASGTNRIDPRALATMFARSQGLGSAAIPDASGSGAPPGGMPGAPTEQRRPATPAAIHPGAFDPASRTFGGAPAQQATAAMHAGSSTAPAGGAAAGAAAGATAGGGLQSALEAEAQRRGQPGYDPNGTLLGNRYALPSGDVYDPRGLDPMAREERQMKLAAAFSELGLHGAQGDLARARTEALRNPTPKLIPHSFAVDGKPVFGFADAQGNLYDANKNRVTGAVTPYEKPEGSLNDRTTHAAVVNGKPMMITVDKQGRSYDLQTGRPITGSIAPWSAPPAPDRVLVQTVGPDGAPIYTPRPQAAGQEAPVHSNESATARAASAKLAGAVAEMNNAHASMADYEQRLIAGKATIGGLQQYLGAVGNDFAEHSPAKQAVALAALNRRNPDLARYIRNGLSFAEGEAAVNGRPSDFRTKMSAFLSMAATNASPEMIADIERRRSSIMTALNGAMGSGARGGGRSTGKAKARDPILDKYGLTPPGGDE